MISRQKRFSIYFIIAILLFVTYLFRETDQEISLPKLGTIPEFEFTDSEDNLISRNDLKGKVWVADFIFTTCTMACPVMTGNMNLIHKAYKDDDQVRIVSILSLIHI